MSIFAIGDLHLSLGAEDKPMDIFGGWADYLPKLETNWRNIVSNTDTVIIPGDICWAMDLKDAVEDFRFINDLPGNKILLKGNHDYWWTTLNKMRRFLQENGFDRIQILHNDSIEVEGVSICGTRGWVVDVEGPDDEKILLRENGRLEMSLNSATTSEKMVFLHYPPVYGHTGNDTMLASMQNHGVKKCFYGHLHGSSIRYAKQGEVDGIQYKLVSADALDFCPYKIEK